MEKDPKLSSLIRESGLTNAPEDFTDKVMGKITVIPVKNTYKPLIGRGGKIVVIFLIVCIVALSLFFSEPGARIFENAKGISDLKWNLPQINLNFSFLSEFSISTGLVSTIVALFLLVLADAGLNRRKRFA